MIETKDITKMVAHIIRRDKGIADPQLMHPVREWFIGLGIATLIVLLGSWFCWYIYTQYSQKINTAITVSESAVPYQAATIAEAIQMFEARQKKFSEIIGGSSKERIDDIDTPSPAVVEELPQVSGIATPDIVVEEEQLISDDTVSVTPVLAP